MSQFIFNTICKKIYFTKPDIFDLQIVLAEPLKGLLAGFIVHKDSVICELKNKSIVKSLNLVFLNSDIPLCSSIYSDECKKSSFVIRVPLFKLIFNPNLTLNIRTTTEIDQRKLGPGYLLNESQRPKY